MPGASLWLRPSIPGEFGVATCLGGPRIGAADVGRGAQRRHGWEDFDWGVGFVSVGIFQSWGILIVYN